VNRFDPTEPPSSPTPAGCETPPARPWRPGQRPWTPSGGHYAGLRRAIRPARSRRSRWRPLRWLLIGLLVIVPWLAYQTPGWVLSRGWHLAPVRGQVVLDSLSVPGAKLLLVPLERDFRGQLQPLSYGVTDQQGRFFLRTLNGQTGAVAGRHLVFVTTEVRDHVDLTEAELDWGLLDPGRAETRSGPREIIPPHYNHRTKREVIVPIFGTSKMQLTLQSNPVSQEPDPAP